MSIISSVLGPPATDTFNGVSQLGQPLNYICAQCGSPVTNPCAHYVWAKALQASKGYETQLKSYARNFKWLYENKKTGPVILNQSDWICESCYTAYMKKVCELLQIELKEPT